MTQFKCGNCQEIQNLHPKSRFCPICGSTSLVLVVKEQAEPTSKQSIGVYTSFSDIVTATNTVPDSWFQAKEDD